MFKRILLSISLILLIPTLLFSSKLFYLGFGSISQFQYNLFTSDIQQAKVIDVHNWATGVEMRSKVLGINFDTHMLIQQGNIIAVTEQGKAVFENDIAQRLFGMVTVGFSSKAATFTTFSIGAGSAVGLNVTPNFNVEMWMGSPDNIYEKENTKQFWENVSLSYRLRIDLNIGSFSLGLHYQVPSDGFSYANCGISNLTPDWEKGKVGASFITRFL
ncbi:MAG: hypothetical protein WDA17_00995 [Sphaerochaetaceae bacterium]